MADTSHGTGGLTFDKRKRALPGELNIFFALIIIILSLRRLDNCCLYEGAEFSF